MNHGSRSEPTDGRTSSWRQPGGVEVVLVMGIEMSFQYIPVVVVVVDVVVVPCTVVVVIVCYCCFCG